MAARADLSDLSGLEREFELEVDDELEDGPNVGRQLEADDEAFEDIDRESGSDEESEVDEEFEDMELESDDYGNRLAALASREFESEFEVDQALGEVFNEIEQEYFFGRLKKGWSQLKKAGVGKLLSKGLKLAAGHIPALQALKGVTSLARGDLKGMLMSLAKSGLGSVVPGGGAVLDGLKSFGFANSELQRDDREAWNGVAELAREAYEHLASNLTENADHPLEAARLATDAFRAAAQRVGPRSRTRVGSRGPSNGRGRRRRIHLRRGDVLIIKCE